MMKVLITGANGFIGSSLHQFLCLLGEFEVFTTDIQHGKHIDYFADLTDEKSLAFLKDLGPDIIVHLAAQSSVPESILNPVQDLAVNALGTMNLLDSAISAGTRNIVYVNSGGAIYGSNCLVPTKESFSVKPESPYAISKLTGEFFTSYFASLSNLEWSSLALSNCFGPVDTNRKGVIYEFEKSLREKRLPEIYGPYVTRDFIYIGDVLEAIYLAMKKPTNCRVHISSGIETSLMELYKSVCEILAVEIAPLIREPAKGQVIRSCLSNELAKNLLGWEPRVPLYEGLKLSLLEHRGKMC